jgi:hypothetical protein
LKSGAEIDCILVENAPDKIKIITEYGLTEMSKNAVLTVKMLDKDETEKKQDLDEKKIKKFKKIRKLKGKESEWDKELTVFVGFWKPPFELDMSEEGGPEKVSLQGSGITYGLRYLFHKYKKVRFGVSGAMQSVSSKEIEFLAKSAKVSGEAGYLQATVYVPANADKSDGVHLIGGVGMSFSKVNYKIVEGPVTTTKSISSLQPILSVGAGFNKKSKSALFGLEARWSYVKQKNDKLSNSGSGFLSILGKISWRFD